MVPHVIHQIVGQTPSELVKICIKSWKKLKVHNFKIIYWDDDSLAKFIKRNYNFALDAFLNARNHAEASDIARYLLIFHYGGYYVDWDISLNDVESFLLLTNTEKNGYLVIDPINGSLASEHFSGVVGNIYLFRIVQDIIETFERDERDLMETPKYSGPYRMRSTLRKFHNIDQSIIPVKEIFEYSYEEIRRQASYRKSGIMTHFWEHSWIDRFPNSPKIG
jgi:mannosyltransferase OCH1-like enzyme